MKIAYILSPTNCNPWDGIRVQAESWRQSLIEIGHEVEFPSMMDLAEFNKYDIIHFFGTGLALLPFIDYIYPHNKNIVVSPIIDSNKPIWLYKLAANSSIPSLRMYSVNGALKDVKSKIKKVFVRSQHEYNYIRNAYNYNPTQIATVMLAHRMKTNIDPIEYIDKKDYCFHISTIYQPRKNVIRLIKAAKKYKFNLVLAGSCGTTTEFKSIKEAIGDANNIQVLGRISEEELINHYKQARVFALPSIEEGVGQVALEAACYGCNIILTNLGGPKEYFKDKAYIINPYSIDEIGKNIIDAMTKPANIDLAHYIANEYSREAIAKQILLEYSSITD